MVISFLVRRRRAVLACLLAVAALGVGASAAVAAKPTVVLVHGAFADASGFASVTNRLQDDGYTVVAPANPLRGPSSDAAYLSGVLNAIKGPIVLVGHSYGGAVITEAATQAPNVKALVYVDALALEEGESNLDIAKRFPGSKIFDALVPRTFAENGVQVTEFIIAPAAFPKVFAADVPLRITRRLATAQRPVTQAAIEEPSTAPAWKTIPSWYLVGRQDQVFPVAAQRFMAKRAKARTVEIDASHASYLSHPADVTQLILRAARAAGTRR